LKKKLEMDSGIRFHVKKQNFHPCGFRSTILYLFSFHLHQCNRFPWLCCRSPSFAVAGGRLQVITKLTGQFNWNSQIGICKSEVESWIDYNQFNFKKLTIDSDNDFSDVLYAKPEM
jgi:hypothetical protein